MSNAARICGDSRVLRIREKFLSSSHHRCVKPKPHCHLPHWQKEGGAYFVTWRLHGSLPSILTADLWTTEGAKFVEADRLLDAAATGPRWLLQPEVAGSVVSILLECEKNGQVELGAWVLMPNHVHVVLRPHVDLPKVISGIKAWSALDCNRLLGRTGRQFWARDYFDRWIRNAMEEQRITRYISQNPVNVGLCLAAEDWLWSSTNVRFGKNAAIAAYP
jgi:putative transposase